MSEKMKWCFWGKHEQPVSNFYPLRTKKIGIQSKCKDCNNEAARHYQTIQRRRRSRAKQAEL